MIHAILLAMTTSLGPYDAADLGCISDADIDGDLVVGVNDLLAVIASWG